MGENSKFPLMETLQSRRACVCMCMHVRVSDKKKGAGLRELMAGLHLQDIIIFTVSYIKFSFPFLLKSLILDQIRPKA